MTTHSEKARKLAAMHLLVLEDSNATDSQILSAVSWLEEFEDHHNLAQEMSNFLKACDDLGPDFRYSPQSGGSKSPAIRWFSNRRRLAVAATFALLALAVPMLLNLGNLFPRASAPDYVVYSTKTGENKVVVLPDDTRVSLGAATSIRVLYGDSFRRVYLASGEALFDVSKNRDRPFTVKAGNGEVTALGTEFNVHRSPLSTTVTLLRGLVKVETPLTIDSPPTILRPNMQVAFGKTGHLSEVRAIDSERSITWKQGNYQYYDASLDEIISDLQRYYKRQIILTESDLKSLNFTGTVNLDSDSIDEWLVSLERIGGINVKFLNGAVVISGKSNL